ncbi:MAG: TlpA family protein disulfide reductase [bacterium]
MNSIRHSVVALAILALSAATSVAGDVSSDKTPTPVLDQQVKTDGTTAAKINAAPDFTLSGIDGKTYRLKDYLGDVVLLDFWATWCGPCKMEIPHLKELHARYKSKGLTVIGVSLDAQGKQAVAPFVEKHQIPFLSLLGNAEVVKAYGNVRSIPTTFLIDRKGVVQKVYKGYQDIAVFEADLKKLL